MVKKSVKTEKSSTNANASVNSSNPTTSVVSKTTPSLSSTTVTSRLDMNLTKEDLVSIMIDNTLTDIENSIKELEHKINVLEDEKDRINSKISADYYKEACKFLPNPLKDFFDTLMSMSTEELIDVSEDYLYIRVNQEEGYKSKRIRSFLFKSRIDGFEISVPMPDNFSFSTSKFEKNLKSIETQKDNFRSQIRELNIQFEKITKSPKRLQARIIKSILEESAEGSEILKVLSNKTFNLLKL